MAEDNEAKDEGAEYRVFRKFYSDMLNIIPITDLTGHLVSANIITPTEDEEVTSPFTSTERNRKLLLKMSGALKSGYTASLYALLDALEKFGNEDCSTLASKIRKELPVKGNQRSSLDGELTMKDFQDCGSPTTAFLKLSSKMEKYFMHVKFSKIRRGCLQPTRSPGVGQFSGDFTNAISRSEDLNELLDILTESNYWNWIDLRIMEAMVIFSDNPAAERTLKNYKEYVSAFTLEEVLPEIPVYIDPVSQYITIEEKFSQSGIKKLTVGHILKHRYVFSYEVCDINPNVPKLCSIKTGCLQLLWSIPRECASHAYKSASININKVESILYLKFEYYPTIYSLKYSPTGHTLPDSPVSRKKPLPSIGQQSQHMCSLKYFKPFTVADEFSNVVDQVTRLLQLYDPGLLIEHSKSIKSSSVHGISFFSKDQLQQLKEYRNTPLLLQELSHLWSWCNHSVLRVLIGCCDEAVKLLDEFDCHFDPLEPIASYPITEVAPINATTHTTLEIKCNKGNLQEFSLQNAIDIGSLVIDKCDITQHCLQLLGATQGFITLYWSIPKCVLHLINTKVLQHCNYFHRKGVLEIIIHPYARINTSRSADLDAIEKQDLSKQLRHVRRQYESVIDENQKLKQDEHNLVASLQIQEKKYKELEEIQNKKQVDVEGKQKEKIGNELKKFGELKVALGKVIKTFDTDAELPIKDDSPVKAEEGIVKVTTMVEEWHQLEYETDDIQKLIDHLQHHADKVNKNMDANKQQQNQWTEELDDLNTKLAMKDKEITKLKDERKLLLKSRRESRETSKQPEIKADKGPYPFQYELLGSGNYGEVYKVHYKDKLYAGKVFHSKLLPGHPNVELPKEFTLKCTLASKFSHPNVEQFVEIARADDKGVPMIITELLIENLTTYISRTSDTFHYNLQLSVCNDMAQGLQYLHSQQFVHMNLHGANVLMTPDHHAKIADYLCPLLRTGVALDSTSTAVYQPPESSQHINVQSNVFTLAVLFLQVITKCFPQLEQHSIDLQGVPSCHPLLVFIQRCLSSDVAARPLMREVCDCLAKLLKNKDSAQVMIFKLIHTTEYPPLLPSLTSGRYQLEHIPCQSLPVPMYWAYAVTIGTKVYVTGGNSRIGDALEHVFRFDLENNKWDKLLPPSEYHHCVPVVLEGKLSLIGGRIPKSKVVIGMVNTYDEEAKQWVRIYPDMKQPRYRPAVVANDSHVIVLGGKIKERSKLTDTIEIMNIKTKQWTMVATTLPDKMYDMSATISNNLVWIIGYDDGSKRSNKVFTVPLDDLIYLTTTKLSWKQLRSDTVCFKTANICYSEPPVILGGDDRQNKTVSAVMAYDPKTESWSEVATLTNPRANCTVVKLPGERGMLVIGGCSETKSLSHCNSSCLSTTEIYYCNN